MARAATVELCATFSPHSSKISGVPHPTQPGTPGPTPVTVDTAIALHLTLLRRLSRQGFHGGGGAWEWGGGQAVAVLAEVVWATGGALALASPSPSGTTLDSGHGHLPGLASLLSWPSHCATTTRCTVSCSSQRATSSILATGFVSCCPTRWRSCCWPRCCTLSPSTCAGLPRWPTSGISCHHYAKSAASARPLPTAWAIVSMTCSFPASSVASRVAHITSP